jgi:hypothetical protein
MKLNKEKQAIIMVIVVVIAMALFAVLVKQSIDSNKVTKQTPRVNQVNQNQEIDNQVEENGEKEVISEEEEENWDDAKVWPEVQFTEEDYEGWETFTNEELGYSIKYPSDWNLQQCDGCIGQETTIKPSDAEEFVSYISISIDSRDMKGIRKLLTDSDWRGRNVDPKYIPYTESKIIFSDKPAYQFLMNTSGAMNIRQLFIKKNGLLYDIDTQRDENPFVRQILASFKFTN